MYMHQKSYPIFSFIVVRKTMVHLLGKLHLADASDERLKAIHQLIEHINKVIRVGMCNRKTAVMPNVIIPQQI